MLKFVETDCSLQEVPALKPDQLAGERVLFFPLKLLFWKINFLQKEDPNSQSESALVAEFSTGMQLGIPAPNLLLHLWRGWLSFCLVFLAHVEEEEVVLAVPTPSGQKGNEEKVSWDQIHIFQLFCESLDTNHGRWAGRGPLCLMLCTGQKGRWISWGHREKVPGCVAAFHLRGKEKQSLLSGPLKPAHLPS